MSQKFCKQCGRVLNSVASWSYYGFCSSDCESVYEALKIVNSKPAMKVVKTAALLLILGAVSAQARDYGREARALARISHRRARVDVITKSLREIDRNVKNLPPGFTRTDLIALALGESGFNHREINRQCVGELGLYQVRPEYFRSGADGLQVALNTSMAVRILNSKYRTARRIGAPLGQRKTTIVCYNGLVRRGGRIDERYWRWFALNRRRVVLALGSCQKTNRLVKTINHRDSRTIAKSPHFTVVACYPAKPTVAQTAEAQYLEEMSAS